MHSSLFTMKTVIVSRISKLYSHLAYLQSESALCVHSTHTTFTNIVSADTLGRLGTRDATSSHSSNHLEMDPYTVSLGNSQI